MAIVDLSNSGLANYGRFAAGRPQAGAVHCLEAPSKRGLATELIGWARSAGVSPHWVADPRDVAKWLDSSLIGIHLGGGNNRLVGFEVTGYAAWTRAQWLEPEPLNALRNQAQAMALEAARWGWPLRWLTADQLRAGERGFTSHNVSRQVFGGTTHTDPGDGYPYDIVMKMVQQWSGQAVTAPDDPNPQPAGPGGADPKTPEQLDEEDIDMSSADILAALAALDRKIDGITTALAQDEDKPRLSLVRNKDDGAIYAYGPGQFDKITNMDELSYGRAIGLYSQGAWLDTDTPGLAVFKGLATEGSGAAAPKG